MEWFFVPLTVVAVLLQGQGGYLQDAVTVIGIRKHQIPDVCLCVQHIHLQI